MSENVSMLESVVWMSLDRRQILALLGAVVSSLAAPLAGFGDMDMYRNASAHLVGAQAFVSLSDVAAHGPAGRNVTGSGFRVEAFCNCACFALDDFAYCQNTAKTTVGVSTLMLGRARPRCFGPA